jgi:hypothetical protein
MKGTISIEELTIPLLPGKYQYSCFTFKFLWLKNKNSFYLNKNTFIYHDNGAHRQPHLCPINKIIHKKNNDKNNNYHHHPYY